jgi:hypothetical protein
VVHISSKALVALLQPIHMLAKYVVAQIFVLGAEAGSVAHESPIGILVWEPQRESPASATYERSSLK